jgi:hypothetical protein
MDCIGFFFYFLCSMWVLSVRSPCHVLCLQASIMAESSKFWQKPTNCATLATFKNEWRLPNFDRNPQIVQLLPIVKNEWYQQGERTTRVLVFGFWFQIPMLMSQVSWIQAACFEGAQLWRGKLEWSFSGFRAIRVFLTTVFPSVNYNLGMRRMSTFGDEDVTLLFAICSWMMMMQGWCVARICKQMVQSIVIGLYTQTDIDLEDMKFFAYLQKFQDYAIMLLLLNNSCWKKPILKVAKCVMFLVWETFCRFVSQFLHKWALHYNKKYVSLAIGLSFYDVDYRCNKAKWWKIDKVKVMANWQSD